MSGPARDAAAERQTLRVEEAGGRAAGSVPGAAAPELSRSRIGAAARGGPRPAERPAAAQERARSRRATSSKSRCRRPSPASSQPEPIPLTIVYQDRDLPVIDKPAGLVVHPGAGASRAGTLVQRAAASRWGPVGIGGVLRPGDRPPAGQGHIGSHGGGEERRRAPRARRRRSSAGRWAGVPVAAWGHLDRGRDGGGCADRALAFGSEADGGGGGRASGADALAAPGAVARRGPAARGAGDGADAPDPGAPGVRSGTGGRGSDVRRGGGARDQRPGPGLGASARARACLGSSCTPRSWRFVTLGPARCCVSQSAAAGSGGGRRVGACHVAAQMSPSRRRS